MNQEKVGQFIKEIRKKNNLTQKQLADKLNVTYQAVSKWENGKNVPDIALLKEISNLFNVDIDEIINGQKKEKTKKNNKKIILLIIITIIILIISIFIIYNHHSNSFEFKTISTDCENFEITGSAAYNKDKSSIYISNVVYCGENDNTVYKKIECNLYESYNNTETLISSCNSDTKVTLKDYLKDVSINVNNYSTTCSSLKDAKLYLQINATNEENKIITYKIPITLGENCKAQP